VGVTAALFLLLRHSEQHWEAEAERLLPGALEQYVNGSQARRKEQQAYVKRKPTRILLPQGEGKPTGTDFSLGLLPKPGLCLRLTRFRRVLKRGN
jgi:hypothetical protein